ncbi:DUF4160 domain-containing protein [Botryobacter ruber]|uniref:DUF4160 domain-containing protein n=1 Tax=Botryobacter ruber TaxID=2171629 RepID=UPI0021CEF392|nr:DUF4160 domain-containing protein [Botryobacter ruber]
MFYSNEHEPIHVHGKYQGQESKAELIFENGEFEKVRISAVKGKEPLESKNEKRLRKLVEHFREDIVKKWVDFFVYNKEVKSEVITKKIDEAW